MRYQGTGKQLRELREKLGLTLKEVERQSRHIAEARQNFDYLFTAGRLSQVENSSSLPSLYKLASLSQIYRTPYADLLRLYGIETGVDTRGNGVSAAPGTNAIREVELDLTDTTPIASKSC